MVSANSALSLALRDFFEKFDPLDIVRALFYFVLHVVLPLLVALLILSGGAHTAQQLWRRIVPLPPATLHLEAKNRYAQGNTQQALKEWEGLDTYGPAFLSRACHEIYVQEDATHGLQVLHQVQDGGFLTTKQQKQALQGMMMDAKAVQKGNRVMVNINAPMVKREHLGIVERY